MSGTRKPLVVIGMLAVLGLAACGGSDESASGTPAQSGTSSSGKSVTDKLFAGTATANRADLTAGKKGGEITVLAGGDVDYMDPARPITHTRSGS